MRRRNAQQDGTWRVGRRRLIGLALPSGPRGVGRGRADDSPAACRCALASKPRAARAWGARRVARWRAGGRRWRRAVSAAVGGPVSAAVGDAVGAVATAAARRAAHAASPAASHPAWLSGERALNNPALIAAELERRREGTSAQQADLDCERQHYHRQLAQCDKDLKRWEAAYLGEAIDLADFKAKKAEVDTRRASAEQELARLDDQQRLLEQAELENASLMDYCARVRSGVQHSTLEEKRQVLEALNITVTWHPEWPKPKIEGSLSPEILAIVSSSS